MPVNCSTLIQRKQHLLHKIIRSNSEGKIQDAVAETTAELHVAGTRKAPGYSSSANHLTVGTATSGAARRANLFAANRIQPSTDSLHQTHLPSIRDASNGEGHNLFYEESRSRSRSRSKTPLTGTSPKSNGRPPSASISSIYNALAKRSTENFIGTNGELDEIMSPVPPSRRSRRPSNENGKYGGGGVGMNQNVPKQTIVPQKQSGDSGIDIRFSSSSGDTNQQQQRNTLASAVRLRTTAGSAQIEPPLVQQQQQPATKERTNPGQLYQRRTNNAVKAPIKQKIDKYRRRSEEASHAMNGMLMNTVNNGLSNTSPALGMSLGTLQKAPPPPPTPVRRVASDAEIQARLDVLRLSMDSNLVHLDHQQQQQQQQQPQHSRNRVKSPYQYSTHQQLSPTTPISSPQTPPVLLRQAHGSMQGRTTNTPPHRLNGTTSRYHHHQKEQQQQHSMKQSSQSTNTGSGNLYLAFIASRHLSTLEDTLFECDIDHQKLLRIFTWLKGVEDHRRQQSDHDQLLIEQNQRMLDDEENLSLYSEIQYAVDDLPANTSGKPCEKIATMDFED